MRSKRGQVGSIAPAMIALVLASAVLVFGLIMTQEVRDTDVISKANTQTVTNESLNITGWTLMTTCNNHVSGGGGTGLSVTLAINSTDGSTIPSTNYTSSGCYVKPTISSPYNKTVWNITYTFNYGDEAYDSANGTIVGLGTFADFWEIIVLAIVISVVIGLLLVVFGRRASGR